MDRLGIPDRLALFHPHQAADGSASWHLTEPLGRHRQCTVELTRHILESDQSGDLDDGVIVELLLKARHEPVIHLHI